jgi:hypothetical protein
VTLWETEAAVQIEGAEIDGAKESGRARPDAETVYVKRALLP